jgi:hypothetical protein
MLKVRRRHASHFQDSLVAGLQRCERIRARVQAMDRINPLAGIDLDYKVDHISSSGVHVRFESSTDVPAYSTDVRFTSNSRPYRISPTVSLSVPLTRLRFYRVLPFRAKTRLEVAGLPQTAVATSSAPACLISQNAPVPMRYSVPQISIERGCRLCSQAC